VAFDQSNPNLFDVTSSKPVSFSSHDPAFGFPQRARAAAPYAAELQGAYEGCESPANVFSSAAGDARPYYQIDLGAEYLLDYVQLCFPISEGGPNASAVAVALFATHSALPAPVTSTAALLRTPCFTYASANYSSCLLGACLATGRYITLQNLRFGSGKPLRFCALQVFGSRVRGLPAPSAPPITTVSSSYQITQPLLALVVSGGVFLLVAAAAVIHLSFFTTPVDKLVWPETQPDAFPEHTAVPPRSRARPIPAFSGSRGAVASPGLKAETLLSPSHTPEVEVRWEEWVVTPWTVR